MGGSEKRNEISSGRGMIYIIPLYILTGFMLIAAAAAAQCL